MQNVKSNPGSREADTSSLAATRLTKKLLACGMAAGPFYLVVGLTQAFTRPGFDITRHSLSLLSNGPLGWIQIANLAITGLLVIASAVGLRRALADGRGKIWGPLLIGVFGLGLFAAAFFIADPAMGFPPGTSVDNLIVSWHGIMHLVTSSIGFLAFIIACFVFARRFSSQQQRGRAVYSVITGVVFLLSFMGIASGSGQSWTILGFWVGLVLVWAWLLALCARLIGELSSS